MSLRIPTRTLRTPRRPAGAERLVVRPRGNTNSPVRCCAVGIASRTAPGPDAGAERDRSSCIVRGGVRINSQTQGRTRPSPTARTTVVRRKR